MLIKTNTSVVWDTKTAWLQYRKSERNMTRSLDRKTLLSTHKENRISQNGNKKDTASTPEKIEALENI